MKSKVRKKKQSRTNLPSIQCPYAKIVAERVATRAAEGMKKYGVTMERTDVSTIGWIDHAIEEALDYAVYLTRLKDDIQKLVGK